MGVLSDGTLKAYNLWNLEKKFIINIWVNCKIDYD